MADIKISALSAGTDPDGTEAIPVVQGGSTVSLTSLQMISAGFASGNPFCGFPPLPNAKFISAITSSVSSGNSDIYLVPSGRRALLLSLRVYNSGTSGTANIALKHSGTYYRAGGNNTISTNAGLTMSPATMFAVEAGDSIAISTTVALDLAVPLIIEFDDTAKVKTVYVYGTAMGDNTVYTVPADKTAVPMNVLVSYTSGPGIAVCCGSVGAGNTYTEVQPSGGSVHKLSTTSSMAANLALAFAAPVSLAAGDALLVNIATNDTAQLLYCTVVEM